MRPQRYYPRIWQEVFAERTKEHTWVRVEMKSGRIFVGALHGSDFAVADGERDIVLRAPIREIIPSGVPKVVQVDRLVISEADISQMSVVYQPRP